MIHETAIIHPSAEIAKGVEIGPYCYVGENVQIGANNKLHSHVVVKRDTQVGQGNEFFQFCSVGEDCQDKKYAGEPTRLEIGDNNVFRESCTLHRGTAQDQGLTKVGSHNLFMAYSHVAHDCIVGDNNILANVSTLAGHVHVGDHVILGGMTAVHQFCHIGSHCFTAGGSVVLRDIPPYVMVGGPKNTPHGINSEGLRRRGFSAETITQIRRAYKVIYRNGHRAEEAVELLRDMAKDTAEIETMADFIACSSRGIVR